MDLQNDRMLGAHGMASTSEPKPLDFPAWIPLVPLPYTVYAIKAYKCLQGLLRMLARL